MKIMMTGKIKATRVFSFLFALLVIFLMACKSKPSSKAVSFPVFYGSEDFVYLQVFEDSSYVIQSERLSPFGCFINYGKISKKDNSSYLLFEPEDRDTMLSMQITKEPTVLENKLILIFSAKENLEWGKEDWVNRSFKLSYSINQSGWINISSDTTELYLKNQLPTVENFIQIKYSNFEGHINCYST